MNFLIMILMTYNIILLMVALCVKLLLPYACRVDMYMHTHMYVYMYVHACIHTINIIRVYASYIWQTISLAIWEQGPSGLTFIYIIVWHQIS